jgi:hypothetical protein
MSRAAFITLAWATLSLHALHALPMLAQAQASGAHAFALNWVRGPGAEACISSSELADRVEQLLGPVFRAPDDASRAIEGLITKASSGTGFHVQIHVVDRGGEILGERSFSSDAPSCETVSAPILLVVALMIDPSASERGLPPELLGLLDAGATPGPDLLADLERERAATLLVSENPPPSVLSERAPRPKPRATGLSSEEPEPAPERGRGHDPNERPLSIELALSPLLGFEIQPSLAPGAAFGVRLVTSGLAFELGANLWLPSEIASTDPSSGKRVLTDLEASGASLRACFDIMRDDDVAVALCAGGAFLVRSFESSALGSAYERPRNSFGPLASLDVRYTVSGPWFALAGAGMVVLLPRDKFYYIDWVGQPQIFYEPSLIGFWGELGFGVRL